MSSSCLLSLQDTKLVSLPGHVQMFHCSECSYFFPEICSMKGMHQSDASIEEKRP